MKCLINIFHYWILLSVTDTGNTYFILIAGVRECPGKVMLLNWDKKKRLSNWFLERESQREGERETLIWKGNIDQLLPVGSSPQLKGIKPATFRCIGQSQPVWHTSQGFTES